MGRARILFLALSLIAAPVIYLTGNLRSALGPLSYHVADLLSARSGRKLTTAVVALREQFGAGSAQRMNLGVITAALGAAFFLATALSRSTNRQYHLAHPELGLENSSMILME